MQHKQHVLSTRCHVVLQNVHEVPSQNGSLQSLSTLLAISSAPAPRKQLSSSRERLSSLSKESYLLEYIDAFKT